MGLCFAKVYKSVSLPISEVIHMSREDYAGPKRKFIGIPKGMLQHITLSILEAKPMSGSELMDEIEYYTDWRPSPGSIYPLLSKLGEEGLIEQLTSEDPFLKRYSLTPSGVKEVEKRKGLEPQIRSRHNSLQKIYWRLFRKMDSSLFEAYLRLLNALEEANPLLATRPEAAQQIRDLLMKTSASIEEIMGVEQRK